MSPKQLATHTVWRRAILPWWRTYFLKNKHTLPSSASRMQPLTTQWSSVVPLKHPARGEPSQAVGAEITGLRLYSATNLPTWLFTPHSSPFNLTALQSRTQSSQRCCVPGSCWCLLPGSQIRTSVSRKIGVQFGITVRLLHGHSGALNPTLVLLLIIAHPLFLIFY